MPLFRASRMTLRATRLPCAFSIAMPSPSREKRLRAITFRLPRPSRTPAVVSYEVVASYLVAVRRSALLAPEQDPGRGVRDQVPLDQDVGSKLGRGCRAGVPPERVVDDPNVMRLEQPHPVALGSDVAASRAVADQDLRRAEDHEAEGGVLRRGDVQHAVLALPCRTSTPLSNCPTAPFRTVTPSCPSLSTPTSQISRSEYRLEPAPSPEIVCPFRSSVTSSAPITIPLFGQSMRSLSSVVSAVMMSPQLTWLASARPPPIAVAPRRQPRLRGQLRASASASGTPFGRVQCPTYCVAYTSPGTRSSVVDTSCDGCCECVAKRPPSATPTAPRLRGPGRASGTPAVARPCRLGRPGPDGRASEP